MKIILNLLIVIAVISIFSPIKGFSQEVTPESVLERYFASIGGKEKLTGISSVAATGTMMIGSERIYREHISADEYYFFLGSVKDTMIELFYSNGTHRSTVNGRPYEITNDMVAGFKDEFLKNNYFNLLKEIAGGGSSVTMVISDSGKTDTGILYGIDFMRDGKKVLEAVFDQEGRLKRVEQEVESIKISNTNRLEYEFSDYRDAGNGLMLPYSITMNRYVPLSISKYDLNAPLQQ